MQQREHDDFRLQAALHDKQIKEKRIDAPVASDDDATIPDDMKKAFHKISQQNILRKSGAATEMQGI